MPEKPNRGFLRRSERRPAKERAKRAALFVKNLAPRARKAYNRVGTRIILKAIEWGLKENQISEAKALELKRRIEAGEFSDFVSGFGAHLLLAGIPFVTIGMGSIARPAYTISARAKAAYERYIRKAISAEEYKRSAQLHSIEAIALGTVPIVGGGAYILSNFIRDPELMNVLTNYLARMAMGERLYKALKVHYAIGFFTRGATKYCVAKLYLGEKLRKVLRWPLEK